MVRPVILKFYHVSGTAIPRITEFLKSNRNLSRYEYLDFYEEIGRDMLHERKVDGTIDLAKNVVDRDRGYVRFARLLSSTCKDIDQGFVVEIRLLLSFHARRVESGLHKESVQVFAPESVLLEIMKALECPLSNVTHGNWTDRTPAPQEERVMVISKV